MKKTTFEKYENFLQACRTKSVIPNIRQMAKEHNVSVTFTNWLIKNRYLVKMTGGSYKFMSKASGLDRIVSAYSAEYAAMRVKEPKIDLTEFAYPISVRCASIGERTACENLLKSIGYTFRGIKHGNQLLVSTKYAGSDTRFSFFNAEADYDYGRYNIDHFNADLIRDIASVRTGDVWVKDEPFIHRRTGVYASSRIYASVGKPVNGHYGRRPTIAEICDHYGYELDGMNIVKKPEAKPVDRSEVVKEISKKADEMQEVINEINALKSVKEREAEAIKLLKSIESDHGVSYSLTRTETTKTVLI